MLSDKEIELLSRVSAERAQQQVKALVSLGEKVAGSVEEQQAARLVQAALAPYVDVCELEAVPVTGYVRQGQASLEVVSPLHLSLPCELNPLSGSGGGEARLLDAGSGTQQDYEGLGGDLRGAVALVNREGARHGGLLTHLALEARRWGASCLLCYQPALKEDLIHIWMVEAEFPVLSISNRSAGELKRLLRDGAEVRVRFRSAPRRYEGISYNVVGTVRGEEHPHAAIYLTAHHDNWFYGANDNASSVACVLEAARALKERRPRHTVRFVVFGAEESGAPVGEWPNYGLLGSYGYCRAHRRELEEGSVLAMINGEILGYSPRTWLQCTPELVPFVRGVVGDMGSYLQVSEPSTNWTLSDHLCFATLGIPTAFLLPARDQGTRRRSPYWNIYHTVGDNLEAISPVALESNARLMALIVHRLDAGGASYSLENLVAAASRDLESIPNGRRLKQLLEEWRAECEQAVGEEGRGRALGFIRVVNRNIYAFDRPFGQKFEMIAGRLARIRDAYHILKLEGDPERARAVLLTLPDFSVAAHFSSEVVAQVSRARAESSLMREIGVMEMDWLEVVRLLSQPGSSEPVLKALERKMGEMEALGEAWGRRLEAALGRDSSPRL